MALFNYKAMTHEGFTRHGSLEAVNEADLEKRLLNMRLDLIKATQTVERKIIINRQKVERRELILFCMQMSQLCRAGVPLLDSLADIRDSVETLRFKEVMSNIIEVIESGKSLSQALEDFPHIFDTIFINLVRAGESTGKLAEIFESLTDMIKWQDELASSTRKLLLTPLFVGTVVFGITIFLMVYLVPQLMDFIGNMGEELPFHTKLLIGTSNLFASYWYVWVSVPVLLFIGVKIGTHTKPEFALFVDGAKLKAPVIGQVLLKIILSRFANFFAMMYAAGIPILNSLQIAEGIIDNRMIKSALAKARDDIEQGAPISTSMASTGLFPPLIVRMLRIGETTGKLDKALLNVSYFYERDIKDNIDRLQALIPPVMTVIVGLLLGWVMLSVLGPVYNSLSKIQV